MIGTVAASRRTMPGIAALALLFFYTVDAHAIVKGTSSSLGSYTVKLAGRGTHCSGVAIARQAIVTAAHCAGASMRLITGGAIAIAGVTRSTTLDDGRRVSVSGDAAIVKLASPLPFSVSPAPVGAGTGDTYIVAGYGTVDEASRGAFGALHEARLVAAGPYALIDPYRQGAIGASACFGDSGGPVMRGAVLVGVISRAAHPSPRIACGHTTRWAPITVSGTATTFAVASNEVGTKVESLDRPRKQRRQRPAKSAGTLNADYIMPDTR